MVAWRDRYQIVRCFRDEDLRKTVTELPSDMEMSFVEQDDIFWSKEMIKYFQKALMPIF